MTALECPKCGSQELATIEDLTGSAEGLASVDEDGTRRFDHGGYTEIHWDSSETQGIECRACGWQHEPFDLDVLVEPDA